MMGNFVLLIKCSNIFILMKQFTIFNNSLGVFLLTLFYSLTISNISWGQVNENFDGLTENSYGNYSHNNFQITNGLCNSQNARSGNAVRLRNATSSLEYVGSDGDGKDGGVGAISFWYRAWDGAPTADYEIEVSINGAGYVSIGNIITSSTTYSQFSYDLNNPSDDIKIRIIRSGGERLHIDDFEITNYAPSTPTLNVSPTSLTGFTYIVGSGPSTSQSFDVSGSNLDGSDVVLTAPTNYEIKLSSASTYASTITLSAFDGTSTSIDVRLKSGLALGTYNGENINISGGSATAIDVACDGEVTAVPVPGCLSDLIISEYVEGSSNNKYIEIYNGTGNNVDLSNYALRLYSNGAASPSNTDNLSGILADGSTIVYANASATVYAGVTTSSPACNFNGDDAIELYNSSTATSVDVVGIIGSTAEPGSNRTLVRKANVNSPNTSYTTAEWDSFAQDNVANLGTHTVSCTPEVNITGLDPTTLNFAQGSVDNILYRLEISLTQEDQTLTALTARIDAAVTTLDVLLSNYKLRYSTDATLDAGDATLATDNAVANANNEIITFTGFNQSITAGSTVYLFITTDVLASAVLGELLEISSSDISPSITTNNGAALNENYNPANAHEIVVLTNAETDIVAVASSEAALISSIENDATISSTADGVQVWQFTIRDGGADLTDADALPTILNSLVIDTESLIGNAIQDWNGTILACALFEGTTKIADATSITADEITFSGSPFLTIPDNSSRTFSLRISLNTTLPATSTDGDDFVFRIDPTNITLATSGTSGLASFADAISSNGQNALEVIATELRFAIQPSNTAILSAMAAPQVIATDANGNPDLDFTNTISISSTGTMTSDPISVNATAGSSVFNSVVHTATGTGFTLTASATGLTDALSNTFDILNTTIFQPGDLVIIGFDVQEYGSGATDGIYFMTMVDIVPGTVFSYVNSRFEAGAAANTRTLRWAGSSNTANDDPSLLNLEWAGTTNISAGSVIKVITNGDATSTSSILVNNVENLSNFNLSDNGGNANISGSAPDQMWLVQGNFTNLGTSNVQLDGQVLFGLTNGHAWVDFTDPCSDGSNDADRESRLHPDLLCFNVERTSHQDATYFNTSALHVGTKRELLTEIKNVANWTNTSSTNIPTARATTTFTVNTGNIDGYWVGDVNTNWFDCANWEGLTVPDEAMDVLIDASSSDLSDIDFTATYSDEFEDIAKCKNLTISGQTIRLEGDSNHKLEVHGNLLIHNTGELDMSDGNDATADGQLYLYGNWENQLSETAFAQGNGTVHFVGNTAQTISNTSLEAKEVFFNLTVDKTGGDLQLLDNIDITGNATAQGLLTIAQGDLDLNSFNIELGDFAQLSEDLANNHLVKDATATDDSNKGGYIRANNRNISNTAQNIAGLGIELNHDGSGADYPAEIRRYHYRAEGRSIQRVFDINASPTGSNTLSIFYAEDELATANEFDLKMFRNNGSWAVYNNAYTLNTTSNVGTDNGITAFSSWTLSEELTPLPARLLSFQAETYGEGRALLTWQTALEQNLSHFEVEKSLNGLDFKRIGSIEARGESLSEVNYQFIDENFREAAYYRLRQLDQDGSINYSQTRFLDLNGEESANWQVYPNPFLNELHISLGNPESIVNLALYDAQGKLIWQGKGKQSVLQNLINQRTPYLAKGSYILRLYQQSQQQSFKLLKY